MKPFLVRLKLITLKTSKQLIAIFWKEEDFLLGTGTVGIKRNKTISSSGRAPSNEILIFHSNEIIHPQYEVLNRDSSFAAPKKGQRDTS